MAETAAPCGWCGEPSVTEVVIRPGLKKKRTAPVCAEHARDFEDRGIDTVRVELDRMMETERKRSQWWKGNR